MVLSLSSRSRGRLSGAPSFFIPFPNSSAAFVTSSELSDFIWCSSDLMECTFFTSSTIVKLSAQWRRASWDYIFAFYGRCVFIGYFIDLTDTMGEHRWLIIMQCLSLAILVDLIESLNMALSWTALHTGDNERNFHVHEEKRIHAI